MQDVIKNFPQQPFEIYAPCLPLEPLVRYLKELNHHCCIVHNEFIGLLSAHASEIKINPLKR
jgi:hypothetical protein